MNCGCYGFTISDNLISIMTIDYKGNKKKIDKEQINFFYRGCNLDENLIILSAKFKGKIDDKKRIIAKQEELLKAKKKSQPKQVKTCGSTFKNPNNIKAWKLIKDSGCENMSVGNAKVSEKHCNFFINDGNTTSQEVEELITKVKNKVFEKTGTNLELEIKIIGINS
jgi:UDP-N-acetylmuramate dehydrogenase